MKNTNDFYLQQEEPKKSAFLALRQIILSADTEISETVKYGMPCFCYSKKAFCYLWSDKKTGEPYILFVEGKQLDFPELESGGRARMKILPLKAKKDLPVELIKKILDAALHIYSSGSL